MTIIEEMTAVIERLIATEKTPSRDEAIRSVIEARKAAAEGKAV